MDLQVWDAAALAPVGSALDTVLCPFSCKPDPQTDGSPAPRREPRQTLGSTEQSFNTNTPILQTARLRPVEGIGLPKVTPPTRRGTRPIPGPLSQPQLATRGLWHSHLERGMAVVLSVAPRGECPPTASRFTHKQGPGLSSRGREPPRGCPPSGHCRRFPSKKKSHETQPTSTAPDPVLTRVKVVLERKAVFMSLLPCVCACAQACKRVFLHHVHRVQGMCVHTRAGIHTPILYMGVVHTCRQVCAHTCVRVCVYACVLRILPLSTG